MLDAAAFHSQIGEIGAGHWEPVENYSRNPSFVKARGRGERGLKPKLGGGGK